VNLVWHEKYATETERLNVQSARALARYRQNVGNARGKERFLMLLVKWWNAIFVMGEGSLIISAKSVMGEEKLHVTAVVEQANLHLIKAALTHPCLSRSSRTYFSAILPLRDN